MAAKARPPRIARIQSVLTDTGENKRDFRAFKSKNEAHTRAVAVHMVGDKDAVADGNADPSPLIPDSLIEVGEIVAGEDIHFAPVIKSPAGPERMFTHNGYGG